jgi:hypothetical protein
VLADSRGCPLGGNPARRLIPSGLGRGRGGGEEVALPAVSLGIGEAVELEDGGAPGCFRSGSGWITDGLNFFACDFSRPTRGRSYSEAEGCGVNVEAGVADGGL